MQNLSLLPIIQIEISCALCNSPCLDGSRQWILNPPSAKYRYIGTPRNQFNTYIFDFSMKEAFFLVGYQHA